MLPLIRVLRDPSLIPLSRQHQHGLAMCVLTNRSLAQDASAGNVAGLARKIIDAYEVELSGHFEIEEQILFPAFEAPLVAELIAQHRRLEALVEELRTAPTPELLRSFTSHLRDHIRVEEGELFESMQMALPREQLDDLGRRIEEKIVHVCL